MVPVSLCVCCLRDTVIRKVGFFQGEAHPRHLMIAELCDFPAPMQVTAKSVIVGEHAYVLLWLKKIPQSQKTCFFSLLWGRIRNRHWHPEAL